MSQALAQIQQLQSQIDLIKAQAQTVSIVPRETHKIRNTLTGCVCVGMIGTIAWYAGANKYFRTSHSQIIAFKEHQIEENMRDVSIDDQERLAKASGVAYSQIKYQRWVKSRKQDIDNTINNASTKILEYKCKWEVEDCSKYSNQEWHQIPTFTTNSNLPRLQNANNMYNNNVPMPDNPFAEGIIQKQMMHKKIISLPAPPVLPIKKAQKKADEINKFLQENQIKQVIAIN
jgi:hypothetical protein